VANGKRRVITAVTAHLKKRRKKRNKKKNLRR
jgi:hypothetical protein